MIRLDLRRDLPKAAPGLVTPGGPCAYTTPCAVGAMMTPEQRQSLATGGDDCHKLVYLLARRSDRVQAPRDQWQDLDHLQRAFDHGTTDQYAEVHAQLMEKYECSEVSSSTSPQ